MENSNIYESVANWWADKIRENNKNTKVSEAKINIFKNCLANLIEYSFKLNGSITISMKSNNILANSMLEVNILSNDFLLLQDEMKLTPNLITVYDQYGHLQSCHTF